MNWQERYKESPWEVTRRRASIVGVVNDAVTGTPIAGAVVTITAGPDAFKVLQAAIAADPAWQHRNERLDQQLARSDGSFGFTDLPHGTYELTITAPQLGSRYGKLIVPKVEVSTSSVDAPPIKLIAVLLPSTRLSGTISGTGKNLKGALVRLRGNPHVVLTDANGRYQMSGLVSGTPVIEATATGFKPNSAPITLQAGQEHTLDLTLEAEPPTPRSNGGTASTTTNRSTTS